MPTKFLASVAILGLLGGCAGGMNRQSGPSPLQVVLGMQADQTSAILAGLASYPRTQECLGKDYEKITFNAELLSIGFDNTNDLDLLKMSRENRQAAAQYLNKFAEQAVEKNCREVARKTYLRVIETYTGAAYASIRQRSQIGIDDLRAMVPQSTVTSQKAKPQTPTKP